METERYQAMIEACFPQLRLRSIAPVSHGWDSVAIEVNGKYIFRFPKRPDVEPQYRKEALLLPELAGQVPAPIPRFEFVWPGGAACPMPFLGHPELRGVALDRHTFAPGQLEQLAGAIGAFLTALHGFPIERAAQLSVPGGDAASWRR